ncbi:MAG TPA: hypothetical protein VN365_00010 [Candidatus Thermoplasmatota archaeon]|nr:hypothetical protein [Candidatus Thermoplasmatota archaeon]
MDKKPLIVVSICAVFLLVLCSMSNVVGYQSVKSTALNDSPLFKTRIQKATNQQQNIITSQYLGIGKGNLLQFPTRDNKAESLKKTIEIINKMDDKSFAQFTELCIQRVRQESITLSDANSKEVVQTLSLLRTKPEKITLPFINRNNQNITSSPLYTICGWFPGCIPVMIFTWIILIIIFIVMSTWPSGMK